ncbi:MAG: hypothetical protein ACQEWG_11200 [Bacteroidota bacterium]
MFKKKNIAILTTVANFDLYAKTSALFPPHVSRYVIDGTNGMHSLQSIFYMFKKLKGKGIDWLIMADEDVIFVNNLKVFELIDYMAVNNYSVCGVRDGGMVSHRNQNPHSINTFFSILHYSELEKIFNKQEVNKNNYIAFEEFGDDLSHLKYKFKTDSLFEPYYCFYFWLRRRGFKFLFLNAEMPYKDDTITNSVFSPEGELILYHTWYARAYGTNEKQTKRINKVLKLIPVNSIQVSQPVIFNDVNYRWKFLMKKNIKKIKMKIVKLGWS